MNHYLHFNKDILNKMQNSTCKACDNKCWVCSETSYKLFGDGNSYKHNGIAYLCDG